MANKKYECNQICKFNNSSDGCVKPAYAICPMVHVGANYSGAAQYKDERAVSPEKASNLPTDLFDSVNYKSPIDVFVTDILHQIESQKDDEIYKAVVSVGINVDKEELLLALRYDRKQYEAGFLAGMAAAKPPIKTNADRLRAMSDRQLADFFSGKFAEVCCAEHNMTAIQLEAIKHNLFGIFMNWLKQPAEVDENG